MNNQGILPVAAPFAGPIAAPSAPRRRLLRSVGAVLAGFAATVVVSTATDLVLHAAGVFPPWGQPMGDALFALAIVYRTIFCVGGCYIAARLAPIRPLQHALVLGALGLIVSTAGTIATWGRGPAFGPSWYPLALIALALPCAWAGGVLGSRPRHARA
jgi:hypothetical protein